MQWHEILIAIPVIIVGAYIRGKIYEHKNDLLKMIIGELDENKNTEGHPFLVYISLLYLKYTFQYVFNSSQISLKVGIAIIT